MPSTRLGGNRLKDNSIKLPKLHSSSYTDNLSVPSNKLSNVDGVRNHVKNNMDKLATYDETSNYTMGDSVSWNTHTYKANVNITGGVENDLANAPDVSSDWSIQEGYASINLITEFKHEILNSYISRTPTYDNNGYVKKITYTNSNNIDIYTIDYVYNNLLLLTSVITKLATGQTITITHNYDTNNRWAGETYS